MGAVVFNGSKTKNLKDEISLNGNSSMISRIVDPTSVAVDAPKGSLIMNPSTGTVYKKNDNGSSTNWSQLAVTGGASANEYAAVIANPAIAGFSTHTTVSTGLAAIAAGNQILITQGTYTETLSSPAISSYTMKGYGISSVIDGTFTLNAANIGCTFIGLKFTGNITIPSGAIKNQFIDCIFGSSVTITDNNTTANQNLVIGIKE